MYLFFSPEAATPFMENESAVGEEAGVGTVPSMPATKGPDFHYCTGNLEEKVHPCKPTELAADDSTTVCDMSYTNYKGGVSLEKGPKLNEKKMCHVDKPICKSPG